jgi:hypothetical protein
MKIEPAAPFVTLANSRIVILSEAKNPVEFC